MAKADDADVRKAEAETRKAQTAERRKAERRKRAERRRQENRKLDELNAVSERVREVEQRREREPVVRSFAAESPRIVLPGMDDDEF